MISTGLVMVGFCDYRLGALSVAIAILASYTARDPGARVTASRGCVRLIWSAGGATSMGVGIWSLHFVAMLAFTLPAPVEYDCPTVFLSLLDELFEQPPQAVALTAVSARAVRVNRAFARLFGHTPQDALVRCRYTDLVARVRRVDAEHVRLGRHGSRLRVAMPYVPSLLPCGEVPVYAT
jgi:PAS domain-containing protein